MIPALFFLILGVLVITDIKSHYIPNYVVIPAVILGVTLTGHCVWPVIMFVIGAIDFKYKLSGGGDVKMITMAGAFLGFIGLAAYLLSLWFIRVYRAIKNNVAPLPYAPFLFVSCLLIQATICVSRVLLTTTA